MSGEGHIPGWPGISKDPNTPEVQSYLRAIARERLAGRTFDLMAYIQDFVAGHTVLDVGVVEHEIRSADRAEWKHRAVSEWARFTLGVDILREEVEALRARGFNVVCADATSDVDLGQRFERVLLMEIIEHVDNPVALLRFARRHLVDDGEILVSTPNPFWFRYIWLNVRHRTLIANAEHVAWITPSMAIELGRRSHLELARYALLQRAGKTALRRTVRRIVDLLLADAELVSQKFLYVFKPVSVLPGASR